MCVLASLTIAVAQGEALSTSRLAQNVLPNGDFSEFNEHQNPAHWNNGKFHQAVDDGTGDHYLVFSNDVPHRNWEMSQRLTVDPQWAKLAFTARLRGEDIRRHGSEVYQDARIQVNFQNAEGKHVGDWGPSFFLTESTDWRDYVMTRDVPQGAATVDIRICLWHTTGRLLVDDLQMIPIQLRDGQAVEMPKFPEKKRVMTQPLVTPPLQLWKTEAKTPRPAQRFEQLMPQALGGKRELLVLNGLWNFVPAGTLEDPEPAKDQWGQIHVPGSWHKSWTNPGVIVQTLDEPAWKTFNLRETEVNAAWYLRYVTIPASWADRQIVLNLTWLSTDAQVFINGKKVGDIRWPAGEVVVTDLVKPGQENVFLIKVLATSDAKYSFRDMGAEAEGLQTKTEFRLGSRGLTGEALLKTRPLGPYVRGVFVKPGVREGKIEVDIDLQDIKQAGSVKLTAQMETLEGRVEKKFTAVVDVASRADQTVQVTWPWTDPRLWDYRQPEMYRLRLTVVGAGMDDEFTQEFGFREVWIQGRYFILNGQPIRLRPVKMWMDHMATLELMDRNIDNMMHVGYNTGYIWAASLERGGIFMDDLLLQRADHKGFLTFGRLPSVKDYVRTQEWQTDEGRQAYRQLTQRLLARMRNSPSIIAWGKDANYLGGGGADSDPRWIGRRNHEMTPGWVMHGQPVQQGIDIIKELDPTRLVYTHHGGNVGDFYAVNHYQNMMPVQEREEFLSLYAQQGDMPYLSIEWGMPHVCTWHRNKDHYHEAMNSEPWMTEYLAAYLGPDAYLREDAKYRKDVRGGHRGGEKYEGFWPLVKRMQYSDPAQDYLSFNLRHTLRSLRTQGLTGGVVLWNEFEHLWDGPSPNPDGLLGDQIAVFERTPGLRGPYRSRISKGIFDPILSGVTKITRAGQTVIQVNSDTLAYLAGGNNPEDNAAFTSKDHSFQRGQMVSKQIAFINDTRQPQPFVGQWRVTVAGKIVAQGRVDGEVGVSQSLLQAYTFALDNLPDGAKLDGEITLSAAIGDHKHEDRFAFRVFDKAAFTRETSPGTLWVYDPAGVTSAMLSRAGYQVRPWDGQAALPAEALAVIGFKAMTNQQGFLAGLGQHVARGGRALVFAQDPEWIRGNLGLRVARRTARRAFAVKADHPIVRDLDALDLRDWTGSGQLVDPRPLYRKDVPPDYNWRWGNRGSVSSGAIETPHHGAWRPILQCEFDLQYAALLELEHGNGRLLWSQLDLEDRIDQDPVVDILLRRIVNYAAWAPLAQAATATVLWGDDKDAALLDSLGLIYQTSTESPTPGGLVIVGKSFQGEAQLEAWLRGGGIALVLPRADAASLLGVAWEKREPFGGAIHVPDWSETRGLSIADLHWKTDYPAWVLHAGRPVETGCDGLLARKKVGSDKVIFTQSDPAAFDTNAHPFMRLTRWRQTRVLSQLLTNLGARFVTDAHVFSGDRNIIPLAGAWRALLIDPIDIETKKPRITGSVAMVNPQAFEAVKPEVDDSSWELRPIPGNRADYGGEWARSDGEAVFRRHILVPESWRGQNLVLTLGAIEHVDHTFFNGEQIGSMNQWDQPREYVVPGRLVRPGRNDLAIRMFKNWPWRGGINGNELQLQIRLQEMPVSYYHADYRNEWPFGDEPYRYRRW